ncbi:MAG TPA: GNAT family N-acetyltransferase [Candidatus Nitrosotalea sp.]|jgi:malonyl-CoA O-methyltransferase|nr:GNAT family N-acetyltransferase [Candidatus Nitrosotalea sp.]
MRIRVLTAADAADFRALRIRGLREHPEAFGRTPEEVDPVEVIAHQLRVDAGSDMDFTLGALDGEVLVGVAGCHRERARKQRHVAHIWGVYVAPEHRRTGLGRRLVLEAIARARTWPDLEWLRLDVTTVNEGARALYVSCGFRPVAIKPSSLRIGERHYDEELMALDLRPSRPVDVAAAYDEWAETYDRDANRTRDLAAATLRQSGLDLGGRDVLEIGCGTGRNTEWLVEQGARVTALDFSAGMLRRAQARLGSAPVRFVKHDVRAAWPLVAGSVDCVIAALVLEHVEDVAAFFEECGRVVRVGGEVWLAELHPIRQLQGGGAEFTRPRTEERVRVAAFLHDVAEYVSAGIRVGFTLREMGESRDPGAGRFVAPQLLWLRFRRAAIA